MLFHACGRIQDSSSETSLPYAVDKLLELSPARGRQT